MAPDSRVPGVAGDPLDDSVSTLPPQRMREVLQRIGSAYYDRPEVLDHLARAVARELAGGPASPSE